MKKNYKSPTFTKREIQKRKLFIFITSQKKENTKNKLITYM